MAIDHPVADLLPAWGAWVRRENDSGLGYSQVQYAELVSRANSATDYVNLDPDVPRLDKLIREHLAYTPRRMLELRYVYHLPDKRVGHLLRLSRSEVNKMINVI